MGVLSVLETDEKNKCVYIHIPQAAFDYFKNQGVLKYALSQIIIHEWSEHFSTSYKGISPHKFGTIMEMFFLSDRVKNLGISDISYFFLEVAAKKNNLDYLRYVIDTYDIVLDPTLGKFYEAIFDIASNNNLNLDRPRLPLYPFQFHKHLLANEAPFTADATEEEVDALYSKYNSIKSSQIINDKEFYDRITGFISRYNIGGLFTGLIDKLNQGKMYFVIDKLDTYFYPRKNQHLGILSFIYENPQGEYEIHLTSKTWEQIRRRKNKSEFLVQLLVYFYVDNFFPHLKGISRHSWAGLWMLHFVSQEAKRKGVSDVDLYYLEKAKEEKNLRYLYLLGRYAVYKDPQGRFKEAVYEVLEELESQGTDMTPQNFLEALAYYRYLFERKFSNIDYESGRINEISKIIVQKIQKFFMVYSQKLLVHNLGRYLKLLNKFRAKFIKDTLMREYTPEEKKEMKELRRKIRNEKEQRNQHRANKDSLEFIKNHNGIIDLLSYQLSEISSQPINERLLEEVKRIKSQDPGRLILIGLYGPTSTGKSTLTDFIIEKMAEFFDDIETDTKGNPVRDSRGRSKPLGRKVNSLSSDSYLHPGDGFRYKRIDKKRINFITGQGIYDLERFLTAIRDLKARRKIFTKPDPHFKSTTTYREIDGKDLEVLVLDLTCLGINEEIARQIDILIPIVFWDDLVRLERRLERDTRPKEEDGDRAVSEDYVIGEFVEKQYEEVWDYMRFILLEYADMIWVQDKNILYKKTYTPKSEDEVYPLALLAKEYSEIYSTSPHLMDNISVDCQVEGDTVVRMNIPVPITENKEVKRRYLFARIFNLIVTDSPWSIVIYAPKSLMDILKDIKESLFTSYPEIFEIVKRMHNNLPLSIQIKDLAELPKDMPTKQILYEKAVQSAQSKIKEILSRIKEIPARRVALGIDVGGTDVKLVVIDEEGRVLFDREHVWRTKPEAFTRFEMFKETLEILSLFALLKVSLDKEPSLGEQHPDLKKQIEDIYKRFKDQASLEEIDRVIKDAEQKGIKILVPSSIGISFPDIVSKDKIIGGLTSKTRKLREMHTQKGKLMDSYWQGFNEWIKPLGDLLSKALQERLSSDEEISTAVVNDGRPLSLWIASLIKEGNILNLSMGTSLAGGLVDTYGRIPSGMFNVSYLVVFIGPEDKLTEYKHREFNIYGAAQILSQRIVFSLAHKKGILAKDLKGKESEVLEFLQLRLIESYEAESIEEQLKQEGILLTLPAPYQVREIFEEVGRLTAFVAATIYYSEALNIFNRLVLAGRVVRGLGGKIIIETAQKVWEELFYEQIGSLFIDRASDFQAIAGLDATVDLEAIAQAVGIVYIGNIKRLPQDPSRPLPNQEMPSREEILKEINRHNINEFPELTPETEEL
ncbi:MAG: hypothetical protein NC820_06750, partial [Candidatus Omnitrophica bacterium]|nr:hypothetical protein [Candidatus Omnitrophota bacterium]